MNALEIYKAVSRRCEDLLLLKEHLDTIDEYRDYEKNDLLRMAIILKISGMDSYFSNKFTESIISYLESYPFDERLANILDESGIDSIHLINLLITKQQEPLKNLQRVVKSKIRKYITQNFNRIDKLFYALGIANLSNSAALYSQNPSLKRSVVLLVRRRNAIAHEADNAYSNATTKAVGRGTIQKIADVDEFVKACDYLIDMHLK